MKFRTEITPAPLAERIDYSSEILSLGSCFADEIASRLCRAKFRVTTSPVGILFNPASIAATLTRFAECRPPQSEEIMNKGDDVWFSLGAHTSLDRPSAEEAETALREATERGCRSLERADWVILTFGTAWIYTHNASRKVAANCHKLPQSQFTRSRLSVEDIVAMYRPLFEGVLRDKQVILTVSPVRHLGDGAEQNSVSKAILRLAVEALCEQYENAHYFPAYELLNDDLRDYRFYADDLAHPAHSAVEYVWEKFSEAALSKQAQELLPRVLRIVSAAEHRPLNARSAEYAEFCRRNAEAIDLLPEIDFSEERAFFEQYFSKN